MRLEGDDKIGSDLTRVETKGGSQAWVQSRVLSHVYKVAGNLTRG